MGTLYYIVILAAIAGMVIVLLKVRKKAYGNKAPQKGIIK